MDYKCKYIKYKNKYMNLCSQNGGKYEFDERNYVPTTEINFDKKNNLNKINQIAGPISFQIIKLKNKEYDKIIYLFGDVHVSDTSFNCNDNEKTMYLPEYLKYYFNINKDKPFDIFVELKILSTNKIEFEYSELTGDKLDDRTTYGGVLTNIQKQFIDCFSDLTNKSKCKELYPNVRFHAIDIRSYITQDFIAYDLLLPEYIDAVSKINLVTTNSILIGNKMNTIINDKYKYYMSKIKIIIMEHFNTLISKEIKIYKSNITNKKIPEEKIDVFMNINRIISRSGIDESIIYTIIEKYKNFVDISIFYIFQENHNSNYELVNKLLNYAQINNKDELYTEINNFEKNSNIKIRISNIMKDTIKKYIGDENGIYKDIDKKFIELIYDIPYLKSRIDPIVFNNFEPEIYKLYSEKEKEYLINKNFIQEYLKTKYITIENVSIINDLIKFMLNIYSPKLMDIYALGRIFKKFSAQDNIISKTTKNIFMIAGKTHTDTYINFFKKIGGELIYNEVYDRNTRCVSLPDNIKKIMNVI